MSRPDPPVPAEPSPAAEERLLSFEVGDTVYTLPIACVLEVTEGGTIAAVPMLPRACGGVMNWHGDALPLVWPSLLFDDEPVRDADAPGSLREPQNVVVVADRPGGAARLGLPVERVLGLVDGPAAASRTAHWVAERRPVDGRVVSVLDPRRLVARAEEVIERSVDPIESSQGGVG